MKATFTNNSTFSLITLVFLLSFVFTSNELAAQEIIQLTNNEHFDGGLKVSGSQVVWAARPDTTSSLASLFHYNLIGMDTPMAITDSDFILDFDPIQISGNKVLWSSVADMDDMNTAEVYYYDLNGQGPVVQLTDNNIYDGNISVSGNTALWQGGSSGGTQTIYHFDLSQVGEGTPEILVDNGKFYYAPVVSGNDAAWIYGDGSDSEVIYYDLSTPFPPQQLSSNGIFDFGPQISGNNLVWYRVDGAIFYYNIAASITVPLNNDLNPYGIRVQMSGSHLVWRIYDGNDFEIMYYQLGTSGPPVQLTDNDIDDTDMLINGNFAVWRAGEEDSAEIYYYDIAQEAVVQLTDNDIADILPQISGNTIAWQGGAFDDPTTMEVYVASFDPATNVAAQPTDMPAQLYPVSPNPLVNEGTIRYTLNERSPIMLKLLDSSGRLIEVLVDETLAAGTYEIKVNAFDLPGGNYYLSLEVGGYQLTEQVMIAR